MKHIHHIIPKHLGGTDDPENLVELTVEEHAEAHKKLWEQHNRWEDYLAWQGLAGLISKEELIQKMLSEAGKKGNISRPTNKGMKYKWKSPPKPKGTAGSKWYHNPDNPSEKCCVYPGQEVPTGWVKGQGKKSVNPGLNFHSKKRVSDGPEISFDRIQ
jgi:hypothetical protein